MELRMRASPQRLRGGIHARLYSQGVQQMKQRQRALSQTQLEEAKKLVLDESLTFHPRIAGSNHSLEQFRLTVQLYKLDKFYVNKPGLDSGKEPRPARPRSLSQQGQQRSQQSVERFKARLLRAREQQREREVLRQQPLNYSAWHRQGRATRHLALCSKISRK